MTSLSCCETRGRTRKNVFKIPVEDNSRRQRCHHFCQHFQHYHRCHHYHLFMLLPFIGLSLHPCDGARIFALQPDIWQPPRDDVFLRYNMTQTADLPPSASEVSVCYWVKVTTLADMEVHVSIASSDIRNNDITIFREDGTMMFFYNNNSQNKTLHYRTFYNLQQWVHHCHVFDHGLYKAFVNGVKMSEGLINTDRTDISLNASVIIGQEQDVLSGGFTKNQILKGFVSHLNIWSRTLTDFEVVSMARCLSLLQGNVMSSERDEMEFFGVKEENIGDDILCKRELEVVVFPVPYDFPGSVRQCTRAGYFPYGPLTIEDNQILHQTTLRFADLCGSNFYLWLGTTDIENDGDWRRISDNAKVEEPFLAGEPNGKRTENCLAVFRANGLWADLSCTRRWEACMPCEKNPEMPLRLRGLCASLPGQTFFEVMGYIRDRPFFHGYFGYMIYLTSPPPTWVLLDTSTNTTLATLLVASDTMTPIGLHAWTLEASMCKHYPGVSLNLSLSACDVDQFMCANGDCLPRVSQCNGTYECLDYSDEVGCLLPFIPQGYRNYRPPDLLEDAVWLTTTVEVLRFLDIVDKDQAFSLEFVVTTEWKDPRMNWLNLHDDLEANRLSAEEVVSIWQPMFDFPNLNEGKLKKLNRNTFARKESEPLPSDFNDVGMDFVYKGESTTIVLLEHYTGSFACSFDVSNYPFDVQQCNLFLQLANFKEEMVAFESNRSRVVYQGSRSLPQYLVADLWTSVTARGRSLTKYSVLKVEFRLSRRFNVVLLGVYLPSVLLLVIGYSTLYVKAALLQVRLTVSLTTLLVLYTLFNQTSSSLPKTANIKMIDIWFFFCIILLFVIIIVHVIIEHLDPASGPGNKVAMFRNHQVKEPEKRFWERKQILTPDGFLRFFRLFVIPFVLSVFCVIYWAFVFSL
ncbi:uncharacterized protein LOC143025389 [Oratosquilla oratoria]|uniref:uncharacterized protein LOC143025389 n=1 Tax=Oratosquilla oratoria TaxID=337810 RepID=UPI003F76B401